MNEITEIISFVQDIGFIGLLIVLAIPKTRAWLGFANGYQPQIDILTDHARVANEEMGEIKKDVSTIKGDLEFIRGKLS